MKKIREFILREVADEYILIPTGHTTEEFNGIITLTETAAFIYNHIEEVNSFEELIQLILKEYNIDEETAVKDAVVFINHLLQTGLITLSDPEKKLVKYNEKVKKFLTFSFKNVVLFEKYVMLLLNIHTYIMVYFVMCSGIVDSYNMSHNS